MAFTVSGAFNRFREDTVDLDLGHVGRARSSRDYLYGQLKALAKDHPDFPRLAGGFIPFGSFARKTKIRPLDDIDLLMLLDGTGTSPIQSSSDSYTYWLLISKQDAPLARYPDSVGYVNSTKVLNAVKSALSSVENYYKADIKKNQQAVVLDLLSYTWVFDIVPTVSMRDWAGNVSYYLIPNGSGEWMRTDPTKDQTYITRVNKQHGGELLPVMRLLKAWNGRTYKPRLPSYYFETLALQVFDYADKITYYPSALEYFFKFCRGELLSSCPDPKGLGPALDADVESDVKSKVSDAMTQAETHAGYALMYERREEYKDAIYWWRQVFGTEFPDYG